MQLKKNLAAICLCVFVVVLFGLQTLQYFGQAKGIEAILNDKHADIVSLLNSKTLSANIKNEYFEHRLPSGMQLFAQDKNNFKLRYEQLFFEVHIFTSKIDSNEYSSSKYMAANRYELPPIAEQPMFVYLQDLGNEIYQLGIYGKGIEVTVNTTANKMEAALLKGIEIIHNTQVLEKDRDAIFIGGNSEQNNIVRKNQITDGDGNASESNEMPIVKE